MQDPAVQQQQERSPDEPWPLEHEMLQVGTVRLHVVQAGPRDGPLAILLHGFPEFWYGWRHQLPYLAERGFRAIAPDQRGYNLSDKPADVKAYRLNELAQDIIGLMDAADRRQAMVVGHDWGGAVAWYLAAKYPDRIQRAAILNVPHPAVMQRVLLHSPSQLLRSSYILYFQLPWLPERLARVRHYALMARALRQSSRPGTFSAADLDKYRQAWRQRGSFRGMLNWYRAIRYRLNFGSEPITAPLLLIWGARDVFLTRQLASQSIAMCRHGQLVVLEEAGHFVQLEEPQRVNELLYNFLAAAGPS